MGQMEEYQFLFESEPLVHDENELLVAQLKSLLLERLNAALFKKSTDPLEIELVNIRFTVHKNQITNFQINTYFKATPKFYTEDAVKKIIEETLSEFKKLEAVDQEAQKYIDSL